jgi:DNA modification methylase
MQVGDVIDLGPHRLVCGDAFNPEHIDLLMQGEKADMLYCDPPYGITPADRDKRNFRLVRQPNGSMRTVRASAGKEVLGDHIGCNPTDIISRFVGTDEQFWWGADYYAEHLSDRNVGSWIVWDKRGSEQLDKGFGSCFELCWSRKRHKRELIRLPWSGFIGIRDEPDGKRHHPTQKPVALAEWFLDRYSKEGATVVDLFGGSGSTLLACERKGRVCRMAELSPQYCDVIIQRYEQMTQQPALIA